MRDVGQTYMRRLTFYLLVGTVLGLFASEAVCADSEVSQLDPLIKRIKAAQKIIVPEPLNTPYDSDPKAKAIYTEEYIKAYRLILAAVMVDCHLGVKGPYEKAFEDGWVDGQNTAMKRHPNKVAEMHGVSLEDYQRYLKELNDGKKQ